jgi:hypothetical protein
MVEQKFDALLGALKANLMSHRLAKRKISKITKIVSGRISSPSFSNASSVGTKNV